MNTDARASGGAGRRAWRSALLVFVLFFVIAQVVLFAVSYTRRQVKRRAVSSTSVALRASAPAPRAAGAVPAAAPALPAVQPSPPVEAKASEPTERILEGPESPPEHSAAVDGGAAEGEETAGAGDPPPGDRAERERRQASRERERRERVQAERRREETRLEMERDRAELEKEKERARAERTLAEKARQEAEREKARQEAEREKARQEAERRRAQDQRRSPGGGAEQPAAPRPAPRPDVLVVLVNSRALAGNLSRQDIRNIYYGKVTVWPNNTPVVVYSRPASSSAGRKFYRAILGASASAFREHWSQLQLSGGGLAPVVVSSAESIVARVSSSPGAIGYVLEPEMTGEVSGVRLFRFK